MQSLSPRQVHLDFHTSEAIAPVAADFDPQAFAAAVKAAHITSMTVFARCHHGMLYYPSQHFPERVHPGIGGKNLLLDQVNALHAAGVRAPVYITVQWDYFSSQRHPEWLIRKADGSHEGGPFTEAGFYQSLCVNTGYVDFLYAQTREVCALLGDKLDGAFFDIVGIRPCTCAACRAEMKQHGLDAGDEHAVLQFAKEVMERFKRSMTALVREYSADATIFYNAGHIGPCTKNSADAYSHFELESLPSGQWGYLHFPATARYARKLGKDCLGVTGKFHTEWGDFHSLKNEAALEFECLRMLSYGFACSIGDQLEPCGRLNPATYELIGRVYEKLERYEPWARPSVPVTEVAVLTAEMPTSELVVPESILGATQLLEELSIQFDVLDEEMSLGGYRLVLLPEDFRASSAFSEKLERFVQQGGAVIAFDTGGLRADETYPPCFGTCYNGRNAQWPNFIVAEGPLAKDLFPKNEYVIYVQGAVLTPVASVPVLSAHAPYFARTGEHFCSHRYTPSAKAPACPAVVQNGRVIVFSHPLLTQYRDCAPRWVKLMVRNAIDVLLGSVLLRHNGPSTLMASVLEQEAQQRYTLHLLSYIPVRKCRSIDIIEEAASVYHVRFETCLPHGVSRARIAPDGPELPV